MNKNARGFTLVESLVVISIIGLLLILILPALQSARETSRRMQCSNNLRQLAIAGNSYIAAYGCLPASITRFSPQSRILAYTDYTNVYNSINFSVHDELSRNDANLTIAMTSIGILLCPTDSRSSIIRGCSSFGANDGVGSFLPGPYSSTRELKCVTPQNVTDGFSNTASMSEWLIGVASTERDNLRSVFQTYPAVLGKDYLDQFSYDCVNINVNTANIAGVMKGRSWLLLEYGMTIYNHTLCMNNHTCTNGTLTNGAAWTASSQHANGVNLQYLDGHVSFTRSSIALPAWRALGTINANDDAGRIE